MVKNHTRKKKTVNEKEEKERIFLRQTAAARTQQASHPLANIDRTPTFT
jgi:hypothetical protein